MWTPGANSFYTLDNAYYGDWVHIQLPERIVLAAFTFTARGGFLNRAPSKFRVYGSNDGSSWSVIHDQTSELLYLNNKATVMVQSSSSYSYLALVVSALPAGGLVLNFLKWKILGKVTLFETNITLFARKQFSCHVQSHRGSRTLQEVTV